MVRRGKNPMKKNPPKLKVKCSPRHSFNFMFENVHDPGLEKQRTVVCFGRRESEVSFVSGYTEKNTKGARLGAGGRSRCRLREIIEDRWRKSESSKARPGAARPSPGTGTHSKRRLAPGRPGGGAGARAGGDAAGPLPESLGRAPAAARRG